jgi:hypothetical protein
VGILINGNVSGFDNGNGYEFEANANDVVTYRPTVYGSYSVNNLVFYPMISKDGGEYEPYHESVAEYCASRELLEDTVGFEHINLINNTAESTGIFTVNADKSVTVNGSSGSASKSLNLDMDIPVEVGETYILSDGLSTPMPNAYIRLGKANDGWYGSTGTGNFIFTSTESTVKARLFVGAGQTLDNLTFYPFLRKVIYKNTAYQPYHASVEESKADTSVIAPTENAATVQKSDGYAVGSHAIRNGKFITWKNAKAQGETINDASDYTIGDVGSWLNPFKEISVTPASGVTLQANTRLTSDGRICVLNLSTDAIDISADTNTTILTVPSEYRPSGIAPLCPLMDFANGKLLLGFLQPSQGTFRVISNEALTGATLRGSLVWTL